MKRILAKHYLLLLARKRLCEAHGIEFTPDELSVFFLCRGCGSLNMAMAHLQHAMEDIVEWSRVVAEIRWDIYQAEEAARSHEPSDEL